MEYVTHNQQIIDTDNLTTNTTIKASEKELTALFGKGMLNTSMWRVLFKDESVAMIYPASKGIWHVESRSQQGLDNVQITLDLSREAKEAEDTNPIMEAFGSAFDIMKSLKSARGDEYAEVVSMALLIRKRGDLFGAMVAAAVGNDGIPEQAAEAMMKIDAHMSAQILGHIARRGNIPATKEASEELIGWTDKIMECEQSGARELFKHVDKGDE